MIIRIAQTLNNVITVETIDFERIYNIWRKKIMGIIERFIERIRESLKRGYYCDCHDRNHRRPIGNILGLIGSYIGVAISLSGLENQHEHTVSVITDKENTKI